jgi:hypothetical protein
MARAEPKPALAAGASRAALGDDLASLLAELPVRIESVTPVTSLAARNSRRASFRIALDDGTALKGRRFDSRFEAERFFRLTRHLALPQIPAATAQRGTAAIEPWVEGTKLAEAAIGPDECRGLGALLSTVHVAPAPAGSEHDIEVARAERQNRLAANLDRLAETRCIDGAFADRIRRGAGPMPAESTIGLIHGDFCPENFVRTESGRIIAVDNETLRFEALDYDLARTWYRWRMDGAQARAFLDGYRSKRPSDAFLRHFPYWAICALVDSIVFRADAGIAGVDDLLRRLDAFLRQRPAFPGDSGDAP